MLKYVGLFALIGLVVAAPGLAQAQAERQKAFKDLIALGYEIKSTIPAQVKDVTYVYVTLQLGKSVAVCSFSIGTWSNMTDAQLEDPKQCDVRFY